MILWDYHLLFSIIILFIIMLSLYLWGRFVRPCDDAGVFIIVFGIEVMGINRNLFSIHYSAVSLDWWNGKKYSWVIFDHIYEISSALFSYTHREDTVQLIWHLQVIIIFIFRDLHLSIFFSSSAIIAFDSSNLDAYIFEMFSIPIGALSLIFSTFLLLLFKVIIIPLTRCFY